MKLTDLINENPALQQTMRQMGAFGGGSKKKKKVGVVPPLSDFVKDKTVKNPETKRDVKVSTAIKDKNHPAHKQAKSLWQKLKDKLKGENLSVNEGRAFVQAARKAKEEGKTEFEFNGKTYPVTLKETTSTKLRDLLPEEETFTATNKKSGETAVFKTKDARDAAVKAGTHSKGDEKDGGDEPKGEKKPNMFSKDAGYDAPDTDKSEPKKDEKKMVKLIKDEMTSVAQSDYHSFSTPLTVDVNVGDNWGMLH